MLTETWSIFTSGCLFALCFGLRLHFLSTFSLLHLLCLPPSGEIGYFWVWCCCFCLQHDKQAKHSIQSSMKGQMNRKLRCWDGVLPFSPIRADYKSNEWIHETALGFMIMIICSLACVAKTLKRLLAFPPRSFDKGASMFHNACIIKIKWYPPQAEESGEKEVAEL